MRIELLEDIIKNPPSKVKFSWLLGKFSEKPPWKTYLGVVILEPPHPPKCHEDSTFRGNC